MDGNEYSGLKIIKSIDESTNIIYSGKIEIEYDGTGTKKEIDILLRSMIWMILMLPPNSLKILIKNIYQSFCVTCIVFK